MPKYLDTDHTLVIRHARKAHRCYRGRTGTCKTIFIAPGDRYVEYFGESPAFSSGHRYCWTCGKEVFGEWIKEDV